MDGIYKMRAISPGLLMPGCWGGGGRSEDETCKMRGPYALGAFWQDWGGV